MGPSCLRRRVAAALAMICLLAGQALWPSSGWTGPDRVAEPDPPTVDLGMVEAPRTAAVARQTAAAIEWTFHKTSDGRHPDGNEQQFLWLMNRARSEPAQEGLWLATMDDPDIVASRDYFDVDEAVLQSEFAGYAAKPPAAFDARLYSAARVHSDYLIRIDAQNHDNQIDRISSAGFSYSQAAGIVFAYARHTLHGYAGFNIDWGSGTNGTQDPPGHRHAIMSISGNYTNVGVAAVPEADSATQVGPLVISGNFCYADTGFADHHNRFIVGTVWEDTNANNQYDPGEGVSGVTVMPDKGAYFAVTGNSGGYAIPITAPGTYTLAFSGGDLAGVFSKAVSVGSASVLLDLEYYASSSANPPVGDGDRSAGGGGGGGGGCLIGTAGEDVEAALPLRPTRVAVIALLLAVLSLGRVGCDAIGYKPISGRD